MRMVLQRKGNPCVSGSVLGSSHVLPPPPVITVFQGQARLGPGMIHRIPIQSELMRHYFDVLYCVNN